VVLHQNTLGPLGVKEVYNIWLVIWSTILCTLWTERNELIFKKDHTGLLSKCFVKFGLE
jgi:hypothetical protein